MYFFKIQNLKTKTALNYKIMKEEQLFKIIKDIWVFKNPNNFNDYHKNIFKKKMNFQKIIFKFLKQI